MSKRRRQDCTCEKKRPEPPPSQRRRKRHLYVVLDDRHDGYTIHKLDLEDVDHQGATSSDDLLRHLPAEAPPVLRLTQPRHDHMFFAALGRHIFIGNTMNHHPSLLYDTRAGALTAVPQLTSHLSPFIAIPPAAPAANSVSDDHDDETQHQLYALTIQDDESKDHMLVSFDTLSCARSSYSAHGWSWKSVPSSSPCPATAPFDWAEESIAASAVHPDGRTIYLSTESRGRYDRCRKIGTYSFDTRSGRWRSVGDWVLPFHDQGYFDTELDAWVGLHRDGHLCSCQVAVDAPQCKMTGETLLHADREQRMGATLTRVGDGRYCVVESVVRDDPVCQIHIMGDRGGCAFRVTLFGLKYDCNGDLKITARRSTTSYAVPKYVDGFSPQAFWI